MLSSKFNISYQKSLFLLMFFSLTVGPFAARSSYYEVREAVVQDKDINEIKRIVEKEGADLDLNKVDNAGRSLLYYAAQKPELVRYLLKMGADPNARNTKKKTTLLHTLYVLRYPESVKHLLDAGADPNAPDMDGDTPLHIAAGRNAPESVKHLLDAGADPNASNVNGDTPLHTAANKETPESVEHLLDAGADPNARNDAEFTPLMYAEKKGYVHTDIKKMLSKETADTSLTTSHNNRLQIIEDMEKGKVGCVYADKVFKIRNPACGRQLMCKSKAFCSVQIGTKNNQKIIVKDFEVYCMSDSKSQCPSEAIDCVLDKNVIEHQSDANEAVNNATGSGTTDGSGIR